MVNCLLSTIRRRRWVSASVRREKWPTCSALNIVLMCASIASSPTITRSVHATIIKVIYVYSLGLFTSLVFVKNHTTRIQGPYLMWSHVSRNVMLSNYIFGWELSWSACIIWYLYVNLSISAGCPSVYSPVIFAVAPGQWLQLQLFSVQWTTDCSRYCQACLLWWGHRVTVYWKLMYNVNSHCDEKWLCPTVTLSWNIFFPCPDVFHWSCLNNLASRLPLHTAPAGYQCPVCQGPVFPPPNLASPVADQLKEQLSTVNWARAGLGLPLVRTC